MCRSDPQLIQGRAVERLCFQSGHIAKKLRRMRGQFTADADPVAESRCAFEKLICQSSARKLN